MDAGGFLLVSLAIGLSIALIVNRQQVVGARTREITIDTLQRSMSRAQGMLQLSRSQLIQLANVTFDAVVMVDKQRQVTLLNDSAREIFHVEAAPIAPSERPTLMAVTRHHQLENMVDRAFESADPIEDQLEIDGRSFKIRVTRVDPENTALAFQDITELLRLTRARRDMVANISHELRTPISSIRLLVDTLSTNIGRNPERDAKLLGKIAGETDNLQFLTEELHDLSMIESGRAIMRLVEMPFTGIIEVALEHMSAQVEKRKLEVINMVPPDLCVLADPDQTRRVLTNLISNALKFTPSGGKLTFSAEPGDSMVTFRVADTGPGIPPSERTRVFERFYQVDTARSGGAQHSGSGLGLAIAKHIIEAQGGKIWIESALPHGAIICFTLSKA